MEVHFTHEQEVRLLKIATHEGIDPAQLVKEAALRLLEDTTPGFVMPCVKVSNRLTRAS